MRSKRCSDASCREAISLADASDLQFTLVNPSSNSISIPSNNHVTATMYYYDSSAATTATAKVVDDGAGWAANETRVYTVPVDTINGFDKTSDVVYGFRLSHANSGIQVAWTEASYVQVPGSATLALLAFGGVWAVRRRRA